MLSQSQAKLQGGVEVLVGVVLANHDKILTIFIDIPFPTNIYDAMSDH